LNPVSVTTQKNKILEKLRNPLFAGFFIGLYFSFLVNIGHRNFPRYFPRNFFSKKYYKSLKNSSKDFS